MYPASRVYIYWSHVDEVDANTNVGGERGGGRGGGRGERRAGPSPAVHAPHDADEPHGLEERRQLHQDTAHDVVLAAPVWKTPTRELPMCAASAYVSMTKSMTKVTT